MSRHARTWLAWAALAALAVGCGSPAAEPTQTAAPPAETELSSPTQTSPPSDTPTPTGEIVTYDDPPGDCILNTAQTPTPCEPLSFDILRVTIERGSPLVITISFQRDGLTSGEGIPGLGDYVVVHGIDVDRDPATGATGGWPEQHGIAPDLVMFYQVRDGQAQSGITQYAADGTSSSGNPSLAEWVVLDDYTIQVTISDELIGAIDFAIAGDVLGPTLYDHYVDHGHLEFPGGEVILVP
jgi:hypothetical protein